MRKNKMTDKEALANLIDQLSESLAGLEEELEEQELESNEPPEDFDLGYVAGTTFAINFLKVRLEQLT
jgi:hypothetical protein